MKRIYLKIIDVDQFDLTELCEEGVATHCLDVTDEDYGSAVEFLRRYINKIEPYLPFDPEAITQVQA